MLNRFRVWNVELDSIENILNENAEPIHLHFDCYYFVLIETI